jgi:hypothetical protein
MLGFEAFEPTGLYQYSTAYSSNTEAFENDPFDTNNTPIEETEIDSLIGPETNNGVKVTYEDGTQFFGISLQDGGIFGEGRLGGDSDEDEDSQELIESITGINQGNQEISGYAVEVAYARDLGNGFNVFVGALFEETEVDETPAPDVETSIDTTVYNAYVTYETGAWLFAAEVIQTEHDIDDRANVLEDIDIDSFLLMANYTYSDKASVTARISNVDVDDYFDATKLTVAHLYAFTDNLALCAEISSVDYDYERVGQTDGDTLEAGVELLFTF